MQRVKTGETTEAMALAKLHAVKARAAALDLLSRRTDGSARKGPLSKRCETALAEPFDATTHPELMSQREQLARGLAELDAILDEDFRVPETPGKSGCSPQDATFSPRAVERLRNVPAAFVPSE